MRTKRFLAVLLAATMVLGSAVTAFAADPDTGVTSGNQTVDGQGASEGYVNTTVVKVVLPVTTANTFAFIMDPQEMLAQTNGARLGTAWTQPKNDTFVYFKTANGYANESDKVWFINKSTDAALDVTVNAKVTEDTAAPITLDTKANAKHETAIGTTEKLYLGLKVGGETVQITNAAAGVDVLCKADNPTTSQYTVVYNTKTKGYEYAEKTGSTFQAVPISVEGEVAHTATEKKAPKLSLTWTWAPKTATAATGSAASVNYVTNNAYTVTNATLDQTAAAYGAYYGGIGSGKGGKLKITGTSATITFLEDLTISKVEYAADGSNYQTSSNVTFKNKVVTIKATDWNATTTAAGAKVKVTFADPDDDATTNNTPDPIIFEKP